MYGYDKGLRFYRNENATVDSDETEKSAAFESKKKKFVKFLLDHGADVNAIISSEADDYECKKSIFSLACSETSADIVKMMIDHGADFSSEDEYGRTPIFFAFESGEKDKIELFFEHGVDATEINRLHLLNHYVGSGIATEEIVENLLKLGANINGLDDADITVLGCAIPLETRYHRGRKQTLRSPAEVVKMVKFLLERGANPNLGRLCSLTSAAKAGHEEIVELLLKHGANINGRPGDEMSPMVGAASSGKDKILKLLLGRGAELDKSALYEAVKPVFLKDNEAGVVKILLDRGYDANSVGSGTVISEAVKRKNKEVVKLLLDHTGFTE